MTTPMNEFRITFNKPAEKAYFEGEDAKGVQTKIEDGSIQFRATESTKGDDIAVISPRGRGGLEALFEGSSAAGTFEVLTQHATQARPFFLLHRSGKGGWFGIRHYDSDGAPPKFEPHIRLWWRTSDTATRPEPVLTADASEYEDRIRAALKVVEDHRESRRIGRPPREVAEAMSLLEGFENLSAKISPMAPTMNIASVMAAFDVVTKFMREVAGRAEAVATVTPVAALSPPSAQAAVADAPRRGGRPKGSKNKAKDAVAPTEELGAAVPMKRRGGRPKGSKNKAKIVATPRKIGRPKKAAAAATAPETVVEAPAPAAAVKSRGGRPKGSKNKPKAVTAKRGSSKTAPKSSIFIRPPARRRGADATVTVPPSDEGAAEARSQLGMAPIPVGLGARGGRRRVLKAA